MDQIPQLWPPKKPQKNFITFLNDFYTPSWSSRSLLTQKIERTKHLILPSAVPFGLFCGACYHHHGNVLNDNQNEDKYKDTLKNVNLKVDIHMSSQLNSSNSWSSFPFPQQNYRVENYSCELIFFLIVFNDDDSGGHVLCTISPDKIPAIETNIEMISFDVVKTVISTIGESYPLTLPVGGKMLLKCPTPEDHNSTKSLLCVWRYYYDGVHGEIEGYIIGSAIHLPWFSFNITCFIYQLNGDDNHHQKKVYVMQWQNLMVPKQSNYITSAEGLLFSNVALMMIGVGVCIINYLKIFFITNLE